MYDLLYDFFTLKAASPDGRPFRENPYEVFVSGDTSRLPFGIRFGRASKLLTFFLACFFLIAGYFSSFNALFAAGLGWIVWSRLQYLGLWRSVDGVEIKNIQHHNKALREHDDGAITITLRNSNAKPVFDVLVYVPCSATADGAIWANVSFIKPRSTARVRLAFQSDAGMGRFEFECIVLSVSDSFGLHTVTVEHALEGEVTVSPEIITLLSFPTPDGFTSSPLGYWETGQAGQSSNFLQLRPWRPGDSIRFIHWARSLRADELLVQSFETTAHVQATFVLDHHPTGHCHFGSLSSLETLRDSLFSLAGFCAAQHIDTRVVTDSWDTGMGRGAQHLALIAQMLVDTRLDGSKHINELLNDAAFDIQPRSLLVLFFATGGFHIEEALETIYDLLQRQVHIVLIGVDSMAFSAAVAKGANLQDEDARLAIREFSRLFNERDSDDEVQRVKSLLSSHTYMLRPGVTLADILNSGEVQHD